MEKQYAQTYEELLNRRESMYDLLLKNGCVVDGSRGKPYHANVCVQDGRIARNTTVREIPEAEEVFDVSG